jgi:hypothetical protein
MNSLLPRMWQRLVFGLLCMITVWLAYPYAIDTNKINIENSLMQQENMSDITLILVLDILMTVGFCKVVLARQNRRHVKKSMRFLGYVPSLLVFPVIFYLQVNLSFLFVGMSFFMLTAVYSIFIFLLVFGGSCLVKQLFFSVTMRMELLIVFSALLFALIICCTVFHPTAKIFAQAQSVNFQELIISGIVIISLFLTGVIMPKVYHYIKK